MRTRSRTATLVGAATLLIGATLLAGTALAPRSLVGAAGATRAASANASTSSGKNPICSRDGQSVWLSAGANGYCFGAASSSSSSAPTTTSGKSEGPANVNAASFSEDVSPAGVRAYGQAEVSTAAVGSYVVEAWNDSTGFLTPCGSGGALDKEELTGVGFSKDGGKTFTDLGGLHNDCTTGYVYNGDPAVEAFSSGGTDYFYIASLFICGSCNSGFGQSNIEMDACTVVSGSLSCGSPIAIATGNSGTGCTGSPTFTCATFPDFLDKEFMTIDPGRSRLYTSYTRFTGASLPSTPPGNGIIELAVCDLTSPGTPTCYPGSASAAYLVVEPQDSNNCENEGAYPAVDNANGDVYVAWEFNWGTNLTSSGPCATAATQDRIAWIPLSCLPLSATTTCGSETKSSVGVTSIDAAFIPGYNRFPPSDFPRIAVSDAHGTVSIVWNDTRFRPLGDILLQSWDLGSAFTAVQSTPTVVNSKGTGMHFLPGLRYVNGNGNLVIGWYERATGNTAVTSFVAANNVSPLATSPAGETTITNVSTNWQNVSSDITPNFGDYTDVYVAHNALDPDASTSGVNDDVNAYYAWSDGRSGDPQPFNAHLGLS